VGSGLELRVGGLGFRDWGFGVRVWGRGLSPDPVKARAWVCSASACDPEPVRVNRLRAHPKPQNTSRSSQTHSNGSKVARTPLGV